MSAPDPARAPASEPAAAEAPPALPPLIVRHLDHLRIQRRLAERTLAMYGDAFRRLDVFCANEGLDLTAVRPHHVRGWTARLHAQGLGPRSIAITLAGWRGLYKWLGREGLVRLNPVEGIKPPKAPKPLPKALPVDQAVATPRRKSHTGLLAALVTMTRHTPKFDNKLCPFSIDVWRATSHFP